MLKVAQVVKQRGAVSPTVRALAWLHFLNDLTLDFLTPLLPAAVGLAWVGFMEGAADAVGQGLKLFSGRASDRSGRRVAWVRGGYIINAIARPLCGVGMLLGCPAWIACSRIGDRIGKGIRGSAVDALVADWTDGETRARSFARMRTMDNLGAVLGGLLSAAASVVLPVEQLGWAAVSLVVVATLVVALCARLRDAETAGAAEAEAEPKVVDAWWPRERRLRLPLAVIAIASLATRLSPLLVLVHVVGLRVPGDGQVWHGCLAWSALAAIQACSSSISGWMTAWLGPIAFLRLAWLMNALAFASLAMASGPWRYAAGAAYAFVVASTDGAEKTWLASIAPRAERARAFGALGLLVAIATAISSASAGAALERVGPITFLGATAALLIALALTTIARSHDPRTSAAISP